MYINTQYICIHIYKFIAKLSYYLLDTLAAAVYYNVVNTLCVTARYQLIAHTYIKIYSLYLLAVVVVLLYIYI